MSQSSLPLKALEAYTRDVGRGTARIDYESMDSLGATTGDIIEIKGKRSKDHSYTTRERPGRYHG